MKSYAWVFGWLLLLAQDGYAEEWYAETLFNDWRQTFAVEETLYEERTAQQDLIIFRNRQFGKVLALDGVIQTTEKDECVYHEMMAHVPILAHGKARSVLVIGGGDGGMLRQVLRHQNIERVVLVEIDEGVIAFSKQHLPFLSDGAFEDARVHIVIEDGMKYVEHTKEKFDVILCDSTDPTGPGAVLFTAEFYAGCRRVLRQGGIFVNHAGVPFLQAEILRMVQRNLAPHFTHTQYYLAAVPTYVGGFMIFAFSSNRSFDVSSIDLANRVSPIRDFLQYYTPAIHKAAFALPKFIENILQLP